MRKIQGYWQTYFIQSVMGGPIKIGASLNPRMRLKELQRASPIELHIVGTIDKDVEFELHRTFKEFRLHGEWFANAPDLVEFINSRGGLAMLQDWCNLVEVYFDPIIVRDHSIQYPLTANGVPA